MQHFFDYKKDYKSSIKWTFSGVFVILLTTVGYISYYTFWFRGNWDPITILCLGFCSIYVLLLEYLLGFACIAVNKRLKFLVKMMRLVDQTEFKLPKIKF